MYRDIIDSYIFDTTKSLPRKERHRIEELLYEDINQRLNEYMEAKSYDQPTYDDTMFILEDFGNPNDVLRKYSNKPQHSLVPQPYTRGLRIDFSLAFIIVALTICGSFFLDYRVNGLSFEKLFTSIENIIISFIVLYFLFTFSFQGVAKSRLKKNVESYLDSLKAMPEKSNTIGRIGIGFQIIISSILVGFFVFSANILDINYPSILILEEYRLSLIPIMLLIYWLNVKSIAYKEIDRRYTLGVLMSTVLSQLGVVCISALIFAMYNLVDPGVQDFVTKLIPENTLTLMFTSNLGMGIFFIVVAIAVLNIVFVAISFHSDKKSFGYYDEEYVEDFEEVEDEDLADDTVEEVAEEVEVEEAETSPLEETRVMSTPVVSEEADDVEDSTDEHTIVISKKEIKRPTVAEAVRAANPNKR